MPYRTSDNGDEGMLTQSHKLFLFIIRYKSQGLRILALFKIYNWKICLTSTPVATK